MLFNDKKWYQSSKKQQKRYAPAQIKDFDPRALYNKKSLILTETDLDNLAEGISGNYEAPQCATSTRLRITLSRRNCVKWTKSNIWNSEWYFIELWSKVWKSTFLEKISITKEQVQHVEIITRNQSKNSLWFKFRQSRITVSIFKNTVCRVSDDKRY